MIVSTAAIMIMVMMIVVMMIVIAVIMMVVIAVIMMVVIAVIMIVVMVIMVTMVVIVIMMIVVTMVVISMFFKQALNLSSLCQCMADRLSSKFIPWSGDDGCFCIFLTKCVHALIICVRLTTIVDACST